MAVGIETSTDDSAIPDDMFRPPVNRAMRVLDRTFFQKRIPLCAARIQDNKNISKIRSQLERSRDVLQLERIAAVRFDPTDQNHVRKCVLLKPEIREGDSSTWSSELRDLAKEEQLHVIPYELHLGYDYWTYYDIMRSILPENDMDEIPSGFSLVGHVAHLNLREQYLQYKHLIADVIVDKNPGVKTVINKIDDVGEENEYRTFKYEVLAGNGDMNVEVREAECVFRFDYSKVYWNTRLNTEHERLVEMFKEGEAVCDVMAGVGPFAVPAGKKHIFVKANDLNPDSYESLVDAIKRNKVDSFVEPYNDDGREFIRSSTALLLQTEGYVDVNVQSTTSNKTDRQKGQKTATKRIHRPKNFSHFVMNLPATAITFLPSFSGIYAGHEKLFTPYTETPLPIVHVYCFSTKSDDNAEEKIKICQEISNYLGFEMTPNTADMDICDGPENPSSAQPTTMTAANGSAPNGIVGSDHFSPYRSDGKLYGFVCVVTGATQPIGKAIAHELASHGAACVYACTSTPSEDYEQLADDINRDHPNTKIIGYPYKLTAEEDTLSLIDDILNAWGRLDVWVTSSGLLGPPSVADTSPSDLLKCFEANSMAPFFALKYAPPAMAKTTPKGSYPNAAPKDQKYGSIVVVSSVASTYGGCWGPCFTMSCHAALGVVRAGVAALKGTGVRINCISPGQIDVGVDLNAFDMRGMSSQLPPASLQGEKAQKENIGLERAGLPQEVGRVAGFLASGFSSYITGANLVVDGGASTMSPLTLPI
ncbi:MAG: tRNA(m(1)G37)methyltransferase [Bogoriella megaspora]|nr:MAG: tRNA(m(1)G37)methyltransferase [Bogoriella megaspora]